MNYGLKITGVCKRYSFISKSSHVYIEDITRRREDMNFISEWKRQYFTNERSE